MSTSRIIAASTMGSPLITIWSLILCWVAARAHFCYFQSHVLRLTVGTALDLGCCNSLVFSCRWLRWSSCWRTIRKRLPVYGLCDSDILMANIAGVGCKCVVMAVIVEKCGLEVVDRSWMHAHHMVVGSKVIVTILANRRYWLLMW